MLNRHARRFLENHFKVKIGLVGPQMSGSIQTRFNEDDLFGAQAHGLVRQELEQSFLIVERVIVAEDARSANAQAVIENLSFKKRAVCIGGIGRRDGKFGVMSGNINRFKEVIGFYLI